MRRASAVSRTRRQSETMTMNRSQFKSSNAHLTGQRHEFSRVDVLLKFRTPNGARRRAQSPAKPAADRRATYGVPFVSFFVADEKPSRRTGAPADAAGAQHSRRVAGVGRVISAAAAAAGARAAAPANVGTTTLVTQYAR